MNAGIHATSASFTALQAALAVVGTSPPVMRIFAAFHALQAVLVEALPILLMNDVLCFFEFHVKGREVNVVFLILSDALCARVRTGMVRKSSRFSKFQPSILANRR